MDPSVTVDLTSLRRTIEERAKAADRRLETILEEVGERVVEYLRSYTGEEKMPSDAYDGDAHSRHYGRYHPGGWVDRTYTLRESFYHEVRRENGGLVLEIGNVADHAHLVEAHDGIFVVRGIAEPGGPVEDALREVVKELAPDWAVTT